MGGRLRGEQKHALYTRVCVTRIFYVHFFYRRDLMSMRWEWGRGGKGEVMGEHEKERRSIRP